jgi:dihydrofolate reductase
MTQLIYYVASSIDGYIADKNGNVDWLDLVDLEKDDHGFNAFYDDVDALIMGRTSYQQILDFGEWPYPGKPCWVMSSQDIRSDYDNVSITSQTPADLLDSIRQQLPGNTWLVGGGKLAQAFHDAGLIDEYFISLIPYILGEGIPLLAEAASPGELRLIESIAHDSGVVQLRYRR